MWDFSSALRRRRKSGLGVSAPSCLRGERIVASISRNLQSAHTASSLSRYDSARHSCVQCHNVCEQVPIRLCGDTLILLSCQRLHAGGYFYFCIPVPPSTNMKPRVAISKNNLLCYMLFCITTCQKTIWFTPPYSAPLFLSLHGLMFPCMPFDCD